MKPVKSALAFLLVAGLGLMSCNANNPSSSNSDDIDLESGEFALFSVNDALDGIEDATMDTDMRFNPDMRNGRMFRDGGPFGRRGPRGPFGPRMGRDSTGNHLGSILRELGLTDDQMSQVRELMSGHRECVQEPLDALIAANQELIDAANVERSAIIDSVRSGAITRDKAEELLRALSENTREAIANNPDSEAPRQAICDCKFALLDNARAILDETQQAVWDEWLAERTGGCFENNG